MNNSSKQISEKDGNKLYGLCEDCGQYNNLIDEPACIGDCCTKYVCKNKSCVFKCCLCDDYITYINAEMCMNYYDSKNDKHILCFNCVKQLVNDIYDNYDSYGIDISKFNKFIKNFYKHEYRLDIDNNIKLFINNKPHTLTYSSYGIIVWYGISMELYEYNIDTFLIDDI